MPNKFVLGNIYKLEISAGPSALVGFVGVWVVWSAVALFLIKLSPLESIVSGFLCACLHWLSELVHHLGHARAARATGYPMRGVRFVHVLGLSLYPRDEPELSGKIHIKRALGGPTMSLVVTLVALLIWLVARSVGGLFYWVALWFFLDNLLVFFLGAFLPLGFTDGSTILKWWGKP